jgi:hypothetical protein
MKSSEVPVTHLLGMTFYGAALILGVRAAFHYDGGFMIAGAISAGMSLTALINMVRAAGDTPAVRHRGPPGNPNAWAADRPSCAGTGTPKTGAAGLCVSSSSPRRLRQLGIRLPSG